MPNYKAIIRPYTWLQDAKGRTWVIVGWRYSWNFNKSEFNEDPYVAVLLELHKTEPIERPYDELVEYFEKNLMWAIT